MTGQGPWFYKRAEQAGILATHIHAAGCYTDAFTLKILYGIRNPPCIHMKGNTVFKIAVTQLGSIVDETLAKSGLKKEEVDWLIPHQANSRIIEATAKRLNLPMERVILTVAEHGNTSAASVPLALDHALQAGQN